MKCPKLFPLSRKVCGNNIFNIMSCPNTSCDRKLISLYGSYPPVTQHLLLSNCVVSSCICSRSLQHIKLKTILERVLSKILTHSNSKSTQHLKRSCCTILFIYSATEYLHLPDAIKYKHGIKNKSLGYKISSHYTVHRHFSKGCSAPPSPITGSKTQHKSLHVCVPYVTALRFTKRRIKQHGDHR